MRISDWSSDVCTFDLKEPAWRHCSYQDQRRQPEKRQEADDIRHRRQDHRGADGRIHVHPLEQKRNRHPGEPSYDQVDDHGRGSDDADNTAADPTPYEVPASVVSENRENEQVYLVVAANSKQNKKKKQ